MNVNNTECEDVLKALKRTSKGRLSYDRNWKEERRTQKIINDIKLKTSSITISPKSVQNISQNKSKTFVKYKVIESPNNGPKNTITGNSNTSKEKTDSGTDDSFRNKSSINKSINDSVNDLDLINYEKQRQEFVSQELNKKIKCLEKEFRKFDEEFDEESKLIRQKFALDAIKKINCFAEDYKALKESILSKQMSFEDNSMSACFKLKEIESKHQLIIEEQLRKQTDLRRNQLLIIRNDIDLEVKSVGQLANGLESVVKSDQYFHTFKQDLNSMIALLQNIDIMLTKQELTESDVTNAQNFKLKTKKIYEKIVSDIDRLKQNIEKPIESKKPNSENNCFVETDNSSVETNRNESEFVDFQAFREFLNLQKLLNEFENSFKNFVTESKFKQKKNELQLFVKTTINTISCESVDHIRDKLNRLTQLFNNKSVEYSGKQINCSERDGSLKFCISMASKMFVSVSTKQKDIALTMAPIVVLLWSRFPTFGQIFLAQMQEKCPYLVPYYPKRDNEDNDETNYLIACGYTISKDGTQEPEESFVNRMRAMIKLFAALIQSNVQTNHPHGLKLGWKWLSRLLNLEPRPVITAAILEAFLSITSHKLYRFYGKQFFKIIEFISNDYIKRIESVTQKTTKRQSLVKLQMTVEDLKRKMYRRVNYKELIPEGVIPDYFFQSSYSHSRGVTGFQ